MRRISNWFFIILLILPAILSFISLSSTVAADIPIVVDTIIVGGGVHGPFGIGVNANINCIYVANYISDTVSVIDGSSKNVVATVNVGDEPLGVGVNTHTKRIYVSNRGDDTVSVIDGSSNSVMATVNVGDGPRGVGVNADTDRIYVSNMDSGNVSVIDGVSNSVVATIDVGGYPYGIEVNTNTNRIYMANLYDSTVSVIDGTSNSVVSTVNVGAEPVGVGVNASTNRIYVANAFSDDVSVIDGVSNSVVATIDVGNHPQWVGVNAITNRIYVTNSFSDDVSVIDGSSNSVVATVNIGDNPQGLGVNDSTNLVYVSNYFDDTVSVIDDNVWQDMPQDIQDTYRINYRFPNNWVSVTTQPLPTIILALDPTFFPNAELRVYSVAAGTTNTEFREIIKEMYPSENGGEYDDFQVLEEGNITLDDGTQTVYMIYHGTRVGYGFEGISVFLVRGTLGFILTGSDFPVTFANSLPLLTQIVKTLHFTSTPVSGLITTDTTWTLANSPYVVTGDVIVNYGVRLTIEPGVTVKFNKDTSLQVAGELVARGTDTNHITFTSNQETPVAGFWRGIIFMDASVDAQYDVSGNYSSGSILQYCIVEYGGQDDTRTIQISSSSPFIDHNTIRNNGSTGIFVEQGSPRIDNNNIYNNSNNATDWWKYDGGGVSVHSGSAILNNNVINDNVATCGGGVNILGSATLSNNTISGNSAYTCGGGISVGSGAVVTLNNDTIDSNIVLNDGAGGGIYSYMGIITVSDTIIDQNYALFGGGIFFNGGTATYNYNQITGNTGGSGIYVFGQPLINYNDIYDNLPYDVYNGNAVETSSGETQGWEEQVNSRYDVSELFGELLLPFAGYNNNDETPGDIDKVISQDAYDVDCTSNWWGTTDEATIQARIYDQSDDDSLGIVSYVPYLLSSALVLPGDANDDGIVNMGDVTKVEQIILGYDTPTPGADANRDGDINMADVTTIERIILGLDP